MQEFNETRWVVIAKIGTERDGVIMTAETLKEMASEFPEVLKYNEATGELFRRTQDMGDVKNL